MVISFIVIVLIKPKYQLINKRINFYQMKNMKKEEEGNATFTTFLQQSDMLLLAIKNFRFFFLATLFYPLC